MSQKTYIKLTIIMAILLVSAGAIMACGATPTPLPVLPTEKIEEDVQVAVVPPPTPTTPATPTPPPAIIAPSDGCEDCHTNQERLIATGDELEVVEELSEGEG